MKWIAGIFLAVVFSLSPIVVSAQQTLTGLPSFSDWEEKYIELKRRVERLESAIDHIKMSLSDDAYRFNELKQKVDIINQQQIQFSSQTLAQQAKFNDGINNLNSQIQTIYGETKEITTSLANLKTQLAQLASELPELKSTSAELSGRIFQLQSELGTIKEKTGLVHGKIESADDTIIVLREEQVKLEQDISRCKQEIARLKGEGVSLPGRVARSPWLGLTAFGLALIAIIIAL